MATGTQKDKSTTETFGAMGHKAGEEARRGGEKVGEQAKQMGERAGEQAKSMGERIGEQAKNIGEKVGEQAKNIGDQARTMASTAVHKTEEAASFLGHKADDATASVGSSMKNLGGSIREHTPGMLSGAGEAVANTLESGGRYLEEHHLQEIGADVTNLIRRNPIPAVLIGIGVGFLLARAIRS
jgi:ElaB/YqjD/DUF883 family membrane-anchored ribosome-binding protein